MSRSFSNRAKLERKKRPVRGLFLYLITIYRASGHRGATQQDRPRNARVVAANVASRSRRFSATSAIASCRARMSGMTYRAPRCRATAHGQACCSANDGCGAFGESDAPFTPVAAAVSPLAFQIGEAAEIKGRVIRRTASSPQTLEVFWPPRLFLLKNRDQCPNTGIRVRRLLAQVRRKNHLNTVDRGCLFHQRLTQSLPFQKFQIEVVRSRRAVPALKEPLQRRQGLFAAFGRRGDEFE